MSSPRCTSAYCRQVIDPNWWFCPYCGQDNRPPANRQPVQDHVHGFLGDRGCCIYCGEPSDEPYNMSRKWRLRLAALSGIGAFLVGLFVLLIQHAHRTGNGPLAFWVAGWYSNPVSHRSRGRYSSYRTHYYTTELGSDVSIYMGLAAVGPLIIALWMFFKVPAPEGGDNDRGGWLFGDRDGDWKPLSRNRP